MTLLRLAIYTFVLIWLVALLVAFVTFAFAHPAAAQPKMCGQTAAFESELAEKYGETRQTAGIVGLEKSDELLVVYASEETGTWTVLLTRANGTSCVVSSGRNWTDVSPLGPQGDDT